MHGLINRAIQCFLRDTYGPDIWARVAAGAGISEEGFEAMLSYPDALTDDVLTQAVKLLDKPRDALLEDLGTYLVSIESLRRLLRFGGVSYSEFLDALEELPGRVHLAVPDMGLPMLTMDACGAGRFSLLCQSDKEGFGHVFVGVLRAVADDYGALALIDYVGHGPGGDSIEIELLEASFAEGRRFDLATPSQRGA